MTDSITRLTSASNVPLGQLLNPTNEDPYKNETIEDMLNRRIQEARVQVEKLCIVKAKAETVGIHKMPAQFIREVLWT